MVLKQKHKAGASPPKKRFTHKSSLKSYVASAKTTNEIAYQEEKEEKAKDDLQVMDFIDKKKKYEDKKRLSKMIREKNFSTNPNTMGSVRRPSLDSSVGQIRRPSLDSSIGQKRGYTSDENSLASPRKKRGSIKSSQKPSHWRPPAPEEEGKRVIFGRIRTWDPTKKRWQDRHFDLSYIFRPPDPEEVGKKRVIRGHDHFWDSVKSAWLQVRTRIDTRKSLKSTLLCPPTSKEEKNRVIEDDACFWNGKFWEAKNRWRPPDPDEGGKRTIFGRPYTWFPARKKWIEENDQFHSTNSRPATLDGDRRDNSGEKQIIDGLEHIFNPSLQCWDLCVTHVEPAPTTDLSLNEINKIKNEDSVTESEVDRAQPKEKSIENSETLQNDKEDSERNHEPADETLNSTEETSASREPLNVLKGQLVNVLQGKTEHMATYIGIIRPCRKSNRDGNSDGDRQVDNEEEEVQVQWAINLVKEFVPRSSLRPYEMDKTRKRRTRNGQERRTSDDTNTFITRNSDSRCEQSALRSIPDTIDTTEKSSVEDKEQQTSCSNSDEDWQSSTSDIRDTEESISNDVMSLASQKDKNSVNHSNIDDNSTDQDNKELEAQLAERACLRNKRKKENKADGNLQNTDVVIKDIRSHIGKLNNSLEQERLNHEATKAIFKDREKVLQQQRSELETKLKSENLRLENINNDLCKKYSNAKAEKHKLTREQSELKNDLKQRISQVDLLKIEKEQLEANAITLKNENQVLEKQIRDLNVNLAKATKEKKELEKNMQDLTNDKQVYDKRLKDAKINLAKTIEELEEARASASAAAVPASNEDVTKLKGELEQQIKEKTELQQNFNTLAMQNVRNSNKIEEQYAEIQRLREQLSNGSGSRTHEE